ncbi:hypothetical protein KAX97_13795 [candidate division WOR-3 bacterium]|nr:hypothetical protein [candidate division WOR-3 bacterium]
MTFEHWEEDSHVRAAFDWFMQFIKPEEWSSRKTKIENYLHSVHETKLQPVPLTSSSTRVSFNQDQLGWCLYLADAYLTHPKDYDFSQGARVIPQIKALGRFIELLDSVEGVHEYIFKKFNNIHTNADSLFFELLVALTYKRNSWNKVALIPESPPAKSPDIFVSNGNDEWFIECKKLAKSSQYSLKERQKWLKMWEPLSSFLQANKKSIILDIVFHVELQTLDDSFVTENLIPKLRFVVTKGVVIDNKTWTVSTKFVDLEKIRNNLSKSYVKIPSSSLAYLITGEHLPSAGFTCVFLGKPSAIHPTYLESIDFISCARWNCDAEEAILKKARDIRRQLSDATDQLPDDKPSIIHVGIESHDGGVVEDERFLKILNTVSFWDSNKKDIQWIYCHMFDPQVPPDENWDFGETVLYFSKENASEAPLKKHNLVELENMRISDGFFWE